MASRRGQSRCGRSRCGQAAVRRSSNAMGHLRSRQDSPMTPFFQVRQLPVLEQVRSSNAFWFLVQPHNYSFLSNQKAPSSSSTRRCPPPTLGRPHRHRLARSGTGVGPASTFGSVVPLPPPFPRIAFYKAPTVTLPCALYLASPRGTEHNHDRQPCFARRRGAALPVPSGAAAARGAGVGRVR